MENYTRARPHLVRFWMSDEELELLNRKREASKIVTVGAFIRKMIFDGYIINVDISGVAEMIRLLRYSSNNLNQLPP